jgi:DNA-binding FadR family transcriptional regulator
MAVPSRSIAAAPAVPSVGERLAAIAPRARTGVLEDTSARIGLAVDLGLLPPGERLPGEDELAGTFGIAPITVRRALRSLCDLGVLERRRGRAGGTFVALDPPRQVLREFEAYQTVSGEVVELIDHRLALESGIAHLAARRARRGHVTRLRVLVADMERAETWPAFRAVDLRFHLELAAVAGAGGAARTLAGVLARLFRFYVPYPIAYLRRQNREHAALVDAVASRDGAAAAAVAERHITELYETVFVSPREPAGTGAGPRPRALGRR